MKLEETITNLVDCFVIITNIVQLLNLYTCGTCSKTIYNI